MKKQTKMSKVVVVVQDQIDKVRDKSPVSLFCGKKSYIDLKAQFTSYLPKLNNLDTRQTALKDLETLIDQNKTQENLRVYLSTLTEYKRPQNFSTNEAEVFLIGLICDSFNSDLIDCLDNPRSLLNTCVRVGTLMSRYFNDSNDNV